MISLCEYLETPKRPSLLLQVAFQLMMSIYKAYLNKRHVTQAFIEPRVESTFQVNRKPVKLSVLVHVRTAPSVAPWSRIIDACHQAHPSNVKLLKDFMRRSK